MEEGEGRQKVVEEEHLRELREEQRKVVMDRKVLLCLKVEGEVNLVHDRLALHSGSLKGEDVTVTVIEEDIDPVLLLLVQKVVVSHSHLSVPMELPRKLFLPKVPMEVGLLYSHNSDNLIHLSLSLLLLYLNRSVDSHNSTFLRLDLLHSVDRYHTLRILMVLLLLVEYL